MRRARAGDGAQVWPLVRDFAVSYVPTEQIFERSFADLLARPDTLVLVAEEGGSILGYLLASWHGTLFADGPVAWVEELMVAPSVRRSGVGRATHRCGRALGALDPLRLPGPRERGAPATSTRRSATTPRRPINAGPSGTPPGGRPRRTPRAPVERAETDPLSRHAGARRPRRAVLSAIRDSPRLAPSAPARWRNPRSAVTRVTSSSVVGVGDGLPETSMSSPLPGACTTVTPSSSPGSAPSRAFPSRTTTTGGASRPARTAHGSARERRGRRPHDPATSRRDGTRSHWPRRRAARLQSARTGATRPHRLTAGRIGAPGPRTPSGVRRPSRARMARAHSLAERTEVSTSRS